MEIQHAGSTLLKAENDILKSRSHPWHQTPAQPREMISNNYQVTGHGVWRIFATLEVPRSSDYHAAEPTPMQLSDEEIGVKIEAIFKRDRRRYGYRRIRANSVARPISKKASSCAPAPS